MAESIEKKIRGATIILRKPIKMVLPKRSRAAKILFRTVDEFWISSIFSRTAIPLTIFQFRFDFLDEIDGLDGGQVVNINVAEFVQNGVRGQIVEQG